MKEIQKNTTNPIQVADKIFLTMETLAMHGPMGLLDLSKTLNINKTTVHRILTSLSYMGYVRQDADTSQYSLSFKLCTLANQIMGNIDIISIAKPHLKELAAKSAETVHLVQRDGTSVVYIEKIESMVNSIRLVSQLGKTMPLYCSAVGKSILAEMSDSKIQEIWNLSDIHSLTPYTTIIFENLVKEIKDIREQGYAIDNQENEIGVKCIAASLYSKQQGAQYALSISAPIQRMSDEKIKELSQYVLDTKEKILAEWLY